MTETVTTITTSVVPSIRAIDALTESLLVLPQHSYFQYVFGIVGLCLISVILLNIFKKSK